jgi:hypothetical protein
MGRVGEDVLEEPASPELRSFPFREPPKEGLSTHRPRFLEMLITIGNSESAEYRYEDDVVVMKFRFLMQHRPFPFGEGIRGMRL